MQYWKQTDMDNKCIVKEQLQIGAYFQHYPFSNVFITVSTLFRKSFSITYNH